MTTTIEHLCHDCDSVATGKALVILARGKNPEMIYYCKWHASYWQ